MFVDKLTCTHYPTHERKLVGWFGHAGGPGAATRGTFFKRLACLIFNQTQSALSTDRPFPFWAVCQIELYFWHNVFSAPSGCIVALQIFRSWEDDTNRPLWSIPKILPELIISSATNILSTPLLPPPPPGTGHASPVSVICPGLFLAGRQPTPGLTLSLGLQCLGLRGQRLPQSHQRVRLGGALGQGWAAFIVLLRLCPQPLLKSSLGTSLTCYRCCPPVARYSILHHQCDRSLLGTGCGTATIISLCVSGHSFFPIISVFIPVLVKQCRGACPLS